MPIKSPTILACAACTCIGYYFGTTRAPQETEAASLPTPPSVSATLPAPAPERRSPIPLTSSQVLAEKPVHPYDAYKAILNKTEFPLLDESDNGTITPQATAFLGITPAERQTIQKLCATLTTHITTLEKSSIKQLESKNGQLHFEIPPIASQIADDLEKTKTGIINLLGEERGSFLWDRLQKTHGRYFADFGIYRTELTVARSGDQLSIREKTYDPEGVPLRSRSEGVKELPARYRRILDIVK